MEKEVKKVELTKVQSKVNNTQKEKEPFSNNSIRNNKKNYSNNKHYNQNYESLAISVVIPLLNEEESLPELAALLETELNVVSPNSWEVLFVDDGSDDNSFEIIKQIRAKNNKFKCIRFRRNYGKSAALSVGFKQARGKIVITMDADLQDDPREIPHLIAKIKEGFDLVSGWKKKRHDPIGKTLPSKLFNRVTSITSGIKLHDFNCGLKAYRSEVTRTLQVYGEMHRYLPALAHWEGFSVTEIPVTHHARKFGKSKFGMARFFNGFLDLLTIVFTSRFLKRPLHFFGSLGILMTVAGLTIDIWLVLEKMLGMTDLSNRPLVNLGIALIIVGVQSISLGLIGEMIVKNNLEKINYSIKDKLL